MNETFFLPSGAEALGLFFSPYLIQVSCPEASLFSFYQFASSLFLLLLFQQNPFFAKFFLRFPIP